MVAREKKVLGLQGPCDGSELVAQAVLRVEPDGGVVWDEEAPAVSFVFPEDDHEQAQERLTEFVRFAAHHAGFTHVWFDWKVTTIARWLDGE